MNRKFRIVILDSYLSHLNRMNYTHHKNRKKNTYKNCDWIKTDIHISHLHIEIYQYENETKEKKEKKIPNVIQCINSMLFVLNNNI